MWQIVDMVYTFMVLKISESRTEPTSRHVLNSLTHQINWVTAITVDMQFVRLHIFV